MPSCSIWQQCTEFCKGTLTVTSYNQSIRKTFYSVRDCTSNEKACYWSTVIEELIARIVLNKISQYIDSDIYNE